MNSRMLHLITGLGILIAALSSAQDKAVSSTDPNEIFNSIMQTIPGGMKERIDSAASIQRAHQENNRGTESLPNNAYTTPEMTDTKEASLDQLPETVREQVRKTMKELEQGPIERMLQFKETINR